MFPVVHARAPSSVPLYRAHAQPRDHGCPCHPTPAYPVYEFSLPPRAPSHRELVGSPPSEYLRANLRANDCCAHLAKRSPKRLSASAMSEASTQRGEREGPGNGSAPPPPPPRCARLPICGARARARGALRCREMRQGHRDSTRNVSRRPGQQPCSPLALGHILVWPMSPFYAPALPAHMCFSLSHPWWRGFIHRGVKSDVQCISGIASRHRAGTAYAGPMLGDTRIEHSIKPLPALRRFTVLAMVGQPCPPRPTSNPCHPCSQVKNLPVPRPPLASFLLLPLGRSASQCLSVYRVKRMSTRPPPPSSTLPMPPPMPLPLSSSVPLGQCTPTTCDCSCCRNC